jgi:hypothetical protein
LRQKYVYAAWFALHFLLIFSFSCRETLLLVAQGPTIFPASFKSFSKKAETAVSVALGQHLTASNAIRQALVTYLHLAGIETGYGYFAPNVPGSYSSFLDCTIHWPKWNTAATSQWPATARQPGAEQDWRTSTLFGSIW